MPRKNLHDMDFIEILTSMYPQPKYYVLPQVNSERVGSNSFGRRVDALVLGSNDTYSDAQLIGFEFKNSRGDAVSEIRNRSKSEPIMKYCNKWYLVVNGSSVAKAKEVPQEWGLMVVMKSKIKTVKKAPDLDPEPMSPRFLFSIISKAMKTYADKDLIRKVKEQSYREGVKSKKNKGWDRAKELEYERRRFEEASGITMWPWSAGQIGKGVRAYMAYSDIHNLIGPEINRIELLLGIMKEVERDA